jgi:DNA adenine methylase
MAMSMNAGSDVDGQIAARPFVKWAGGKRQLLPELRRFVPNAFGAYHEPFFGSGALFFDLVERQLLAGKAAFGWDTNRDLIGCYAAIRDHVDEVIGWLGVLRDAHRHGPEENYYRVRDRVFNPSRRRLMGEDRASRASDAALAAMFVYLNRTGFNGLYRLNSRGDFNVPMGRYTNPLICDEPNLRRVAAALRRTALTLVPGEFGLVLQSAQRGDLIYFDPPYAPVSPTANFTSYTSAGFAAEDQARLRDVAIELAQRECFVVVSNSAAPLITDLYAKSLRVRKAGLRVHRVAARRAINSDATRRGDVVEYIISNVRSHR